MTDEESEALRGKLRPRLTDEFLATLVAAANLSLGDYMEVDGFVGECFQMAGKNLPKSFNGRLKFMPQICCSHLEP